MRYVEPVFRPPSEAESYLLPVTTGCSHNRCGFCAMYRGKSFRARPESEVFEDIALAGRILGGVRRVFLLDGDAFVLSPRRLLRVLERLGETFPDLGRVGTYVNAANVAAKTDAELAALAGAGLRIGYLGLESGDPQTLGRIDKGATADEMVEAVVRAQAAGIRMSVMSLLGLAGKERSAEHAAATAAALNRMQPRYVAFLTVTPVAGTPFAEEIAGGAIEPLSPLDSLRELRAVVAGLDLGGSVFSANHASNYLPLRGRLPADRSRLLDAIDAALAGRTRLRPEFLRGL